MDYDPAALLEPASATVEAWPVWSVLEDRLLVRPVELPEVSKGGITLVVKDRPNEGIVLRAGPGRWDAGVWIENPIPDGARVLFGKYAGQEVALGDEKLLILTARDVFLWRDNP